jgi:hypothetical protein
MLVQDVEQHYVHFDHDHVVDYYHQLAETKMGCFVKDSLRFPEVFSRPRINKTIFLIFRNETEKLRTASFFARSSSAFLRKSGTCRSKSCNSKR